MAPLAIVGFVLGEFVFMFTLASWIIRAAWLPVQNAFPQQSVLEPSYRKNFQSFSFGIVNAGWCFHCEIDDNHLHLFPLKLLTLFGCQPASVPWTAMQLHAKQPWWKSQRRVLFGTSDVVGPAWCFELLKH